MFPRLGQPWLEGWVWNGGRGDSITVDAWKVLINSHYFLHWPIILSLLGYSCLVSLLTKIDPQMPLIFNFSVYKIWKIETFVRICYVFLFIFSYFIHLIEMKHICRRT